MPVANAFIIGPPRTGTTSLAMTLAQHPEVMLSTPKESSFIDMEFREGRKAYDKYFPVHPSHRQPKIFLDANPHVSWIPYCAERIKMVSPNAKILMTVRNPIERMYSHWRLLVGMRPGREVRSFPEFVNASEHFFNTGRISGERDLIPFHDGKKEFYVDYFMFANMYAEIYTRFRSLFREIAVVKTEDVSGAQSFLSSFLGLGETTSNMLSAGIRTTVESKWEMYRATAPEMSADEIQERYPLPCAKIRYCCGTDAFKLSELLNHDFAKDWGL